jgi:hypothetical protein
MRFRGVSITMVGAATLLLALDAPEAGAQRGRLGILRPAPLPNRGVGAARPRWATLAPGFFNTCFVSPFGFAPFGFSPFFGGGFPFINIQVFANGQPAPDPTSHVTPDPNSQAAPFGGSHPLPGPQPAPSSQPIPGLQPAPGAMTTSAGAVPTFAAPVYSAPVYATPVYAGATPVATPQVSGNAVIGDVIVDPSVGLWASPFFFGGGVTCVPNRLLGPIVVVR